jgi:hypothetical protein
MAEAARLPFDFNEQQLECLCYCCQWHVPNDHKAPMMSTELACLKDADNLDRVRLDDLDVRYLRTPIAKALVPQAKLLYGRSHDKRFQSSWELVRAAALELNLWC